jgi:hypothetical protein
MRQPAPLTPDELKALDRAKERGFTDRDITRRGLEALGFLPIDEDSYCRCWDCFDSDEEAS